MKLQNFEVKLSGQKTKATRIFMESYIAFLKEKRWCAIHWMHLTHLEQFDKAEQLKGSQGYSRLKCAQLYHNCKQRIKIMAILDNGPETVSFNGYYNYGAVYEKQTLDAYIALVERAMELPKEFCDDLL